MTALGLRAYNIFEVLVQHGSRVGYGCYVCNYCNRSIGSSEWDPVHAPITVHDEDCLLRQLHEILAEQDSLRTAADIGRKALKLCIGMHTDIPWYDVREQDVDGFLTKAAELEVQRSDHE